MLFSWRNAAIKEAVWLLLSAITLKATTKKADMQAVSKSLKPLALMEEIFNLRVFNVEGKKC